MIRRFLGLPPEWVVVVCLLVITLGFSWWLGAPLELPGSRAALFVGVTYLTPFALIIFWLLLPCLVLPKTLGLALRRVGLQVSRAACFFIVMFLHFHLKLWAPLINGRNYDLFYENFDDRYMTWLAPVIAWRNGFHDYWLDTLYFDLFAGMFFVSFCVHCLRYQLEFRRVFLATLLSQALGAIGYLIAPALGPFIYRPGVNPMVTATQHLLWRQHEAMMSGGIPWLRVHTPEVLWMGLGAMPSLHTAVAFIFLYYSQRYCLWLALLCWPAFLWIIFEAMASRWHYSLDVVAGLALAIGCITLANVWVRAYERIHPEKMDF